MLLSRFIYGCLLVALVLANAVTSTAQTKPRTLEQEALVMFAKEDGKVFWQKNMKGYLDGVHEIEMVLLTDNKRFRGAYEYTSSHTRFLLEGQFEGDEVVLHEIDSLGRISGFIRGSFGKKVFYGEWSDVRNQDRLAIELYEQLPYTEPCGNVGWAKYFTPKYDINPLQKVAIIKNESAKFIHYIANKKFHSYPLECEDVNCTKLSATFIEDGNEVEVNANISDDQVLVSIDENDQTSAGEYLLDTEIDFNCVEYADYCSRYFILVPSNQNKKLNKWVRSKIDNFKSICQLKCKIDRTDDDNLVSKRFGTNYFGYLTIDLIAHNLISGVFVFQNTENEEVTEIPFIFDTHKGEEYEISRFFKKEVAVYDALKKSIDKVLQTDTESHSEWIDDQPHSIFSLSMEGVVCRTAYHPIYGQHSLVIPYAALEDIWNQKYKL